MGVGCSTEAEGRADSEGVAFCLVGITKSCGIEDELASSGGYRWKMKVRVTFANYVSNLLLIFSFTACVFGTYGAISCEVRGYVGDPCYC